MRKLIYSGLALFFILFFWNDANAQLTKSSSSEPYANAVGIRLTSGIGGTYKTGMGNDGMYAELLAVINPLYNLGSDTHFSGLLEFHNDIVSIENLRWYFGGGARIGIATLNDLSNSYTSLHFGPVGIAGIEYTLEDIPLNISIDFVPYIRIALGNTEYFTGFGVRGSTGGLSARYIF